MPDSTKNIATPVLVDLPAVYSQGGFVQSSQRHPAVRSDRLTD